jgi:hypothetical protein
LSKGYFQADIKKQVIPSFKLWLKFIDKETAMKISVHVEYEDGSNASGKKVFLDIHGLAGNTWLEDFTDNNGNAGFELDEDGRVEITFIVDGDEYQTDTVSDGDCITIAMKWEKIRGCD